MPIDPAGTAPGLAPDNKPDDVVHMKCRREGCDSMTATIMKIPGQETVRRYICTACKHSWGLNMGGPINI